MIYPATGWIEIRTLPSSRTDHVANQVEYARLTNYALPNKTKVDRENDRVQRN